MEWPHPHSVSTSRDQGSVPHRTPQGVGKPMRAVATGVREQVRRLGCVTPHNPRIFTSRLQPGARRMSPPQSGTEGLREFRAICRSRPIRCGQRFQRRLPGRCGAVQAACHRYYRHSWTRDACRSRLDGLPAHAASRAHHHADSRKGSKSPTPLLPCHPTRPPRKLVDFKKIL